jgi:hypothetical protein
MNATTHPLTARLSAKSSQALILWIVFYCKDTPNAVTPESLDRARAGDKYDRLAVAILSPYA